MLEVFLSMLYFVPFFIRIWLAISVFADSFRSHDLRGVPADLEDRGVISDDEFASMKAKLIG